VPVAERETGEGLDKIMNVELVNPDAVVAAPTGPNANGGRDGTPWRRLRARLVEEVSFRRSLRELRRLDDRDLDDLDLGRGDLPGLARHHAREVAARA
jgi:uncharacterized protein YjiS (DUF1127 family)